MATISTKSFTTLVSNMVAAVQGQATALVDFSSGGMVRSWIEAVAGAVLWLQGLVLQVAALTRLSTSTGSDVDSFVNDFGFERQGAVAAVTTVTFARFTPTAQAVVQPGANVGTLDGTQSFTVTTDAGNPAWSASLGGYVLPAATASISGIPVQNTKPGASGNVVAGAIGLLLTAVPGVDTVTNSAPATGGSDAESDAQVKTGFQLFILSLASATLAAITNAVKSVQASLGLNIAENANPDGSPHPGFLTVTVDDGTGSPPSALLQSSYQAVDRVRAAGIAFGVFAPNVVVANVVMEIIVGVGFSPASAVAAVQTALANFIAGLTLGQGLPYTKLAQIATDASAGVSEVVPGYTLNAAMADIAPIGSRKIVVGTIAATHT